MTAEATERPTLIEILRLGVRDLSGAAGEVPDVAADARELLAGDVQLGLAEMRESAQRAGMGAAFAGGAAMLANIGIVFACLTLMFALWTAMDLWLAALITTLVIFGAAFVAYQMAMSRFKMVTPMPKRAMQSLGKDISWLKAQMKLSGS